MQVGTEREGVPLQAFPRQLWKATIPGGSVLLLSPSQMLHRLAHVVKDRNAHDGLASSERVAASPVGDR